MGKRSKKKKSQAEQERLAEAADLEKRLSELGPEEAEMFARALEMAMKKRRVMLFGHLSAVLAMIVGFFWALYLFGTREPGTFIGWVFLVPFAVAGALLYVFGKLAKRMGK